MSRPRAGDWKRLKKAVRCLKRCPRLVQKYWWQEEGSELEVFSDSDWAGYRKTARGTSGGVVMHGSNLLKVWSRTQRIVALSSGEAGLIAMVKATCEALDIRSLWKQWGRDVKTSMFGDSTGALGVVKRRGAGKLRHVRIGTLWVHDLKEEGVVGFKKIPGEENSADRATKHIGQASCERHAKMLDYEHKEGRANSAAKRPEPREFISRDWCACSLEQRRTSSA